MDVETVGALERLAARLTHIRGFTSMRPTMQFQIVSGRDSFLAYL